MAAVEMLCQIIGINPHKLSKEENLILEAEIFSRLCDELKKIFKEKFNNYFRLMKLNEEMEEVVLESSFIRCVINDILASETYTLSGIAFYTQTPEDIIYEVASGQNTSPSLTLSRRIIELHRTVRPDLYKNIILKIAKESLAI